MKVEKGIHHFHLNLGEKPQITGKRSRKKKVLLDIDMAEKGYTETLSDILNGHPAPISLLEALNQLKLCCIDGKWFLCEKEQGDEELVTFALFLHPKAIIDYKRKALVISGIGADKEVLVTMVPNGRMIVEYGVQRYRAYWNKNGQLQSKECTRWINWERDVEITV